MSASKFVTQEDYFAHVKATQGKPDTVKPTVKCHKLHEPSIGERASVFAIDHPAVYLNGQMVNTSPVVSADENGFETLNTKYVYEPLPTKKGELNGSSLG
jgi:hypothetical protein